jgi:hypothetical protein
MASKKKTAPRPDAKAVFSAVLQWPDGTEKTVNGTMTMTGEGAPATMPEIIVGLTHQLADSLPAAHTCTSFQIKVTLP